MTLAAKRKVESVQQGVFAAIGADFVLLVGEGDLGVVAHDVRVSAGALACLQLDEAAPAEVDRRARAETIIICFAEIVWKLGAAPSAVAGLERLP